MTSAEIRQSFLDFFKSKGHTIVPSSSLLPDSPNLLFTNAGMNQFVPIFLGQRAPDVSKWSGASPPSPPPEERAGERRPTKDTRAADTQKCIRAGGKHNDLEDVGLDTYHLTFFEMLGNWSFGDYFKKESLTWGWELLTKVWGIPGKRLFATVYAPDKSGGDPAEFDQEASDIWTEIFRAEGLDPKIHIVHGNKKDNFWMMGETGPCGPCSEIHFNLLPSDDEQAARALVNASSQRCIEIWNHVFIQFNANPDGTYSPLPAKHVDTGMGFDRIAGFFAGTKGFKEFSDLPSAYNTDIFTALFAELEKLSHKKYTGTLPKSGSTGDTDQEKIDIAFRVIADHIRTLSFAIADGIQPGNTDRNYVLRRILRRAVRYGRTLDFHEPFFYKLVSILAENMGHVFPEIRAKQSHVEEVIQREEEAFNKTLDRGIELFDEYYFKLISDLVAERALEKKIRIRLIYEREFNIVVGNDLLVIDLRGDYQKAFERLGLQLPSPFFSGKFVFELYDTYGFPLDLTELMARERGLSVDVAGFNKRMEEQRDRARKAQKKEIIEISQIKTTTPTKFVGYDLPATDAKVVEVVRVKDKAAVVFDTSPLYAEMGGQVGDTGYFRDPKAISSRSTWNIISTQKTGNTWVHLVEEDSTKRELPSVGSLVSVSIDGLRRAAIERHHTVTHILHYALRRVLGEEVSQKGSFVGPDKLTFDFNAPPISPQALADIEKFVNNLILLNDEVSWTEVPYSEIKGREDVMQFFGEKYGDKVRVVQIGGKPTALDGYSMELCGGTHTRATGEIGLFRIVAESAIASGVRRIEAVSGLEAYKQANEQLQLIKTLSGKVNTPVGELEKKIESLLAQQKELEKQLKSAQQKQAAETARSLVAKAQNIGSTRAIIENVGPAAGDFLQSIADNLKGQFKGVVVIGGSSNGAVSLVATVSPDLTKQIQAGKIIQAIAPIVGGKGGGRPDNARGGGKEVSKLDEALTKAKTLL